jgi:putative transport protein
MAWFGDFLHRYPDLAAYLAVGLGYLIGGYKIKGFGLGPVTGPLLADLLIGQLGHVPVSGTAKSILGRAAVLPDESGAAAFGHILLTS